MQFLIGYGVSALTIGKLAAAASVLLVGVGVWLLIARVPATQRRWAALAAAIAVLGVAVPILAAGVGIDYLKTFCLIGTLPLFAIALAQGFRDDPHRYGRRRQLVVIGLALTGLVAATPFLQRQDLRGLAAALGDARVDRAIVVAPTSRIDTYLGDLRRLPPWGTRVREVVFVSLPIKEPGKRAKVTRSLSLPSPGVGFQRSRQTFAERFTIVRFRARRPLMVTRVQLMRASFPEWPMEVTLIVLQDSGSG